MNDFSTMTVNSTKRTKLGIMAPKKFFSPASNPHKSPSGGTYTGQVLILTVVGKGGAGAADSTDKS